ncbi:amino acid ABC transporter permease [Cellulomonas sp. PhB143]|uniref:amino acid ABC transporter permease n=1 Tax=Cellulomonas sp. PhB143 TaxID=2485186 RepID=UPI000F4A3DC4|nr:amino acid ABC transporter permease [Cellulomonas sp. PhB143]ROS77172.1 glutamate transport system permease protein [Cellulomonas sp. PhB143]
MSSQTRTVLFDAPGPVARRRIRWGNLVAAIVVLALAAVVLLRLQQQGQLEAEKWTSIFTADAWTNFYLPGLLSTLRAAAVAVVGAVVFGLVFGMGRLSHMGAVRVVSTIVVEFFRAVPVLLMMIFFWLLFAQKDLPDPSFWAVVLSLILYNGSVVAELVRSGVHGLPSGQREAALAIGLTRDQSLRSIEVPQALVAMLPALVSQLVVVLKDSALGAIILYPELLQQARLFGSGNSNILQSLTVAAVMFILINYSLTKAAEALGGRLRGRTAGSTGVQGAGLENGAGAGATLQAGTDEHDQQGLLGPRQG